MQDKKQSLFPSMKLLAIAAVAGVIAGTWRPLLKVIGDRMSSGESAVSQPAATDKAPPAATLDAEALAPG